MANEVNGPIGTTVLLAGMSPGGPAIINPAAFLVAGVGSDGVARYLAVDSSGNLAGGGGGGGGSGTVTSIGLSAPGIFSVSGSPVTTSGTLALGLATQTANTVWAGPTSGGAAAPTFRALVLADMPAGIVTSVGLTAPNIFSVTGSPVTTTGTLAITLATQAANLGFFGPTSGAAAAPTFRALVEADLGTGTGTTGKFLRGDMTWSNTLVGPLLFSADNTHDIGASGATRPRTIYTGTSVESPAFILGTRQDYTVTNSTTDRAFDANATSIDELADVLGTLIGDLITAGLLQ